MTSKIKVDNIENQCGGAVVTKCGGTTTIAGTNVNATTVTATNVVGSTAVKSNALQASDGGNLVSQSGTTITLGASGDTINLASGASQSGFGREGSVNWQTGSIKTSTFTAASGEGYFCNTTGGIFTVNLPAGSAGAIVSIADYTRTFETNNLTVSPNGSEKIGGVAQSLPLNINGQALTLIYVDGTEGWINVQNAEDTETGLVPTFTAASGGTVTTCGDFKIHRFLGPGTFTVSSIGNPAGGGDTVDYLVVAGGGGGSNQSPSPGQGGGAGGFRLSNSTCMPGPTTSPLANPTGLPVSVQGYPITVSSGGAVDDNASPSIFSTITSSGGGSGFGPKGGGGSGGGDGGTGNSPPVSPPQGNPGGPTNNSGGGGAGAAGGAFIGPNNGGIGGDGSFVSPTFATPGEGTPGPVGGTRYFAGGGAGGYPVGRPTGIAGGAGGGGFGAEGAVGAGNGLSNSGGGGGGGGPGGTGTGGSGIVIIRYKFQ